LLIVDLRLRQRTPAAHPSRRREGTRPFGLLFLIFPNGRVALRCRVGSPVVTREPPGMLRP
jgi:hypothetical protein